MFDIAWSELFVIGAVALVAIGPKDLPKTMLVLGRATRQVRQMAQQVRQQFDQLNYEAEIAVKMAEEAAKTPPPAPPMPTEMPSASPAENATVENLAPKNPTGKAQTAHGG